MGRTEGEGPARAQGTPQECFLAPAKPGLQGNWYALDNRLFKKRVERLAELAGCVDFTKRACPDEAQRAKLTQAVALIHGVAVHYDTQHGWGLYDTERAEATEVAS